MSFSTNLTCRAWFVTIHEKNMIKAGLTEEQYKDPRIVAETFVKKWMDSGKSRIAGIVVCLSKEGLYHAHMACYGSKTTTLKNVSKILYDSHVEPQLAKKAQLLKYLKKEGEFEEKGEQVIYALNLEAVDDNQGERNDVNEIVELLNNNKTPEEIFETNFNYRRYEKMICGAFADIRYKQVPSRKQMYCSYHFGESGTGKTNVYLSLCDLYQDKNVYLMQDYPTRALSGNLDFYSKRLCDVLFIDEFRGGMSYETLLDILDVYKKQIRCRYANVYSLWTKVFITSVLSPEEVYENMVSSENRKNDSIRQFLRRLTVVVYHFKTKNGYYCTYSVPADCYQNRLQMLMEASAFKQEVESGKTFDINPTGYLGCLGGQVIGKETEAVPVEIVISDDF